MAESAAPLLAALKGIVGEANVLTAEADVAPYSIDWRDRYRGRPRAVVRPGTTAEVAAAVRCCAEHAVPIVPQGGNTSMCGAATPHDGGHEIVVSLTRMNRVRAVDPDNATLTVEAGATLASVQQAAAGAGLMFPLSLGAEGSCAIGGNLSTNAGGTAVLRFGNARDLVLGLEVVLADGRVWNGLRALRKDNTGYDLRQLFVGSEGTLGIITAAVLKLFPRARTSATAFAAVTDVASAVDLLRLLRDAIGDRLTGFELISAECIALTRRELRAMPDPLPGHAWYALDAAFPGLRYVTFGHLGDGNLHYNLAAPQGTRGEDFIGGQARANRIVYDLVARFGGSFSAEHGVGQLKREELTRYKSPLEVELMRRIKRALDPEELLNPGKVL